jgi:hypothetical protein
MYLRDVPHFEVTAISVKEKEGEKVRTIQSVFKLESYEEKTTQFLITPLIYLLN